jgi:hypothetical protein
MVLGGSGATGESLISQLIESPHCTQIITIGRRPPHRTGNHIHVDIPIISYLKKTPSIYTTNNVHE